jgi:hypothetical protein
MSGKYLTFFLVIGMASSAINGQNKTDYKDIPEKPKSETGTSPTNPSDKNLDNPQSTGDSITQGKSKTSKASMVVRVAMGILGVICYELKECRELLNVQPASQSERSSPNQTPYTYLPRFDASIGKYSFVMPSSANSSSLSSGVNSTPSFYYKLAPNWSISPNMKAGKVTILPQSGGKEGLDFKTAIILGVLPIQSENTYVEAQNYVQQMVETNPYLSNTNGFSKKTIGNKQCYYKQLFGYSKNVEANETVTFFGCTLDQNTMFYSVLVYNDKTTESDKQSFWQIWNSVEFAK